MGIAALNPSYKPAASIPKGARSARLPIIPRQGKIPALSLLNIDVAACVAIFWLY
jgi:hypothetical protein